MSDSPYKPDSTAALDILAASPFFGRLDKAARAEIADDLEIISLAAGETLFRQGDPGDSMYIVDSGLLEVRATGDDDQPRTLDRLDAGAAVGELALLTGQPRTADVVAVVDSRLLRIEKVGFDRLAARHPAIESGFAIAITPRIQRLKLAGILGRLFGDIDPATLHTLQEQMTWRRLADGETLVRQGEAAASMFILVNGRLQIVREASDEGDERALGEIGAGETVGEFALLSDDVRSATIVAVRDSDVVEITRPVFERLIRDHPQAMGEISRIIVARQKRSLRETAEAPKGTAAIAVVPAGRNGANLAEFAARLADALSAHGPTAILTSERFDAEYGKPGAAQTEPDDTLSIVINSWLQAYEQRYGHILFVADAEWSVWTRRCLAQSDCILLVGDATDQPDVNQLEMACHPRARKELVLLHPDTTARPTGTLAWLKLRDVALLHVAAHHHVLRGDAGHWQRLARRLTGRAVGMAFSGGAARGMAHMGAIRALDEADIPVDYIGGTSMGAFIGGGWACGRTPQDTANFAARLARGGDLVDKTFPFTSVMASAKITGQIKDVVGEVNIEDLWRPFFCVSTNLSTAELVVHDRGPLWWAVRASAAMPGVFTPMLNDNNELLVDGGVMNNLPLDVLASRGRFSLLIGSNVSPRREEPNAYDLGVSLSGWKVLWNRINPLAKPLNVPTLAETVLRTVEVNSLYQRKEAMRLADILIEPDTRGFDFLDVNAYGPLERRGYEAARKAIAAWREQREEGETTDYTDYTD